VRGGAATWILVLGAGCGGLETTTDAPPGSIDGGPTDGGPPDAAGCSYTCYAQSMGGMPSAMGTAACRTPSNTCQPAFDWLESIDACACSFGSPALYVLPVPPDRARVALVAPPSPVGLSVSMTDTDGNCYGAGACADPSMACGNLEVSAWVDIPLANGSNQFTIYDDDGTGCANARYAFIVDPL
jgi:hypothetical protein